MATTGGVAARLTKVIDVCALLYQGLKEFEAVVLKENEAIGRSDLAELESITDEKIVQGDRTTKLIQALQDAMDQLAFAMGHSVRKSTQDHQLSHFVDDVGAKLESLHPELKSQFEQFKIWAKSLKDLRQKIFVQIETNAYLVQKLLDYHRETYAFWQSVAQDAESGYGRTGKTKYGQSGPSKSLLTVRT